jgi:hypothetical protein
MAGPPVKCKVSMLDAALTGVMRDDIVKYARFIFATTVEVGSETGTAAVATAILAHVVGLTKNVGDIVQFDLSIFPYEAKISTKDIGCLYSPESSAKRLAGLVETAATEFLIGRFVEWQRAPPHKWSAVISFSFLLAHVTVCLEKLNCYKNENYFYCSTQKCSENGVPVDFQAASFDVQTYRCAECNEKFIDNRSPALDELVSALERMQVFCERTR